jgi:hypothetical protein
MLPSSILEVITAASEAEELGLRLGCNLSIVYESLVEPPREPGSAQVRFLMIEVRLTRLPPLLGLRRMLRPNSNKLDQELKSSGVRMMSEMMLVKDEQQAGLADLGMCLIMGMSMQGCEKREARAGVLIDGAGV